MINLTVGKVAAISRLVRSDVWVSAVVGLLEPLRLLRFAHERPHDPDAGDLLAQHTVDPVDPNLHLLERRHHAGHDRAEQQHRPRDREHEDHRQPDVFAHRQHDPDHHRERCGDHHRRPQHHQHLDLLDVVGDPGDQRRRPELADLAGRVVGDLVEQIATQVAPERHRRLGTEPHGRRGEHDLHDAECRPSPRRFARCSRCRRAAHPC